MKNGDNPFLNLVPTEFLTKKGKKYNSTYLESFTRTIIDAFEDDLTAAHRNADNKTVYAIQQSNFLNKMLSKLKKQETLDEYLNKIKNDEILSNLPLIQSLTDDDGNITGVAGNLEVTVIDALARSGKSKSVPYTKLSDPEMVAVEMALFHNSNNSQYARFKFPVPSDAPTMPTLKALRKTNEQVIEDLVVIGMSEIKRINKFKKLPKDAKARRIVNYKDKATQFNILSFLNDKITNPDTVSEEQMRKYIVKYLENEFLEKQKEAYKEAGAIKSFEKGKNGDIVFSEKIISSEYNTKSKRKDFYINFLYNQYLMNSQISTLFAGEPAFYKNTVDYQKRFKQIVSPGTFTNHERVGLHYHGYIFEDEYVPSTKESAEFVIENIKKSNLPEQKKKELIAKWEDMSSEEEGAETNNTSDGATFISIDRMLDIERSLDRITREKLIAAERIRNGEEKPGDAGLFNIYKPFVFTKTYNNGIETPLQKKDSEMLLTKSYAYRKDSNGNFMYPKLVEAYNILNDENSSVSFISFESAIKVGRVENLGKDGKSEGHTVLEKVVENGVTRYKLPENAEIITLNHEDWRLQQETPNHFQDDSGNYGTQLRVLAIADIDLEETYVIDGEELTGRQVSEEYQDLITENIRASFEEVKDMFLNEDCDIDIEVLTEHLRAELEDGDAGEEYFEAIALIKDELTGKKKTKLPLWHPLITYKVESIMNSFFKNKVINQKINGGSFVNATSFGTSRDLKYNAKTNTYDALLSGWSKNIFPQNEFGQIDINKIPEKLLRAIAYRIPTEDKYSIFNIRIVGFNDAAVGGHIVLPPEATTLSGLDFDFDKMFVMIPNHRIDEDGNPVYIEYISKNSEKLAYSSLNNKKSRDNRLMELLQGVLMNKGTALSTIDSGNYDKLAELGHKIQILNIPGNHVNLKQNEIKRLGESLIRNFEAGNIDVTDYRSQLKELVEKYENIDFNINLPSTQLKLFHRNMAVNNMLPALFNHLSHHWSSQRTDLKLTNPIHFGNKRLVFLNRVKDFQNIPITKNITSIIKLCFNKDYSLLISLGLRKKTIPFVLFLIRLGFTLEMVISFLSTKVIVDLINRTTYSNELLRETKKEISYLHGKINLENTVLNYNDLFVEQSKEMTGVQADEHNYRTLLFFEEIILPSYWLNIHSHINNENAFSTTLHLGGNYQTVKRFEYLEQSKPFLDTEKNTNYGRDRIKETIKDKYFKFIGLISPMNPSIYRIGEGAKYSNLGKVKNDLTSLKRIHSAQIYHHIDNSFKAFLLTKSPFFSYINNGVNNVDDILFNTPKDLIACKKKFEECRNNIFLQRLAIYINKGKSKHIKFYKTGKSNVEDYKLSNHWLKLIYSSNEEVVKLGFDLIKYAFFSSGLCYSINSFHHLIPVEFWTDAFCKENEECGLLTSDGQTLNDIMKEGLFGNSREVLNSIERFKTQYLQNFNRQFYLTKTIFRLNQNGSFLSGQYGVPIYNTNNLPTYFQLQNHDFLFKTNDDNFVIKLPKLGLVNLMVEYDYNNEILKKNQFLDRSMFK